MGVGDVEGMQIVRREDDNLPTRLQVHALVAWLWTRLDVAPAGSLFRYWLLATIVLVSLSLLIDAVDVTRYQRGEREPYLETPT